MPCTRAASACHKQRTPCRAANNDASQFDVDSSKPAETLPMELGPREDDVLPDSLADAVAQAASATAAAIAGGSTRCQVEILLPEFWDPISGPLFPNKGDQDRFWRITRRFVERLQQETRVEAVKAIYPDAGVAAMLAHRWPDRSFQVASLNSRRPVDLADGLVVMTCPDPPGADDCIRIVRQVGEQDEKEGILERPIVMFNQRLSSGDVGIGLNARRLRESFLKRFVVTYSLRPVGDLGTVFKRYPGMWQVFVEEQGMPGRYKLAAEQPNRPAGEALDAIIQRALGGGEEAEGGEGGGGGGAGSLVATIASTMSSMQRFMRSLSN